MSGSSIYIMSAFVLDHFLLDYWAVINTLEQRNNGRNVADDISKCNVFNGNCRICLRI